MRKRRSTSLVVVEEGRMVGIVADAAAWSGWPATTRVMRYLPVFGDKLAGVATMLDLVALEAWVPRAPVQT